MSSTFVDYADVNSLGEFNFIGGTDYTLEFTVYDENGSLANISGATCSWVMAPYGKPDQVLLTKTGTITSTTTFEVTIDAADTLALNGKFMHQPIVEETGKSYRTQQGVIYITPAIN